MGNFRKKQRAFMLRNRNNGIPNLMLWICIGNALVFVVHYLLQQPLLELLIFSPQAIMHGEVWRLFSYIFTFASMSGSLFSPLFGALISIMFYYWIGKVLENSMSTLRFNLYYVTGILLTDLYLLLIYWIFKLPQPASAHYINLSMFLAVATLMPEQRLYIYFIIPVKMKWLAWLDIGLCLYETVSFFNRYIPYFGTESTFICIGLSLIALYPWVSLLNYFIFFGSRVKDLFPKVRNSYRQNKRAYEYKQAHQEPNPDWAKNYRSATGERPYRHKCTVCGRTDTTCPGLEFRYCSRCKGYFCYCIDHINNHTHVE